VLFAHDTEVALVAAAALVNTAGVRPGHEQDTLTDRAALDEFVAHWRFSGSRQAPPAAGERDEELEAVRDLRPELRRLWTSGDPRVVAEGVNRLLADGGALPQLVRHDGWDWHLHATAPEQPLAVRMAVEAAMALVDVVRGEELARLKVCEADDCEDLHVDLSKNRSRRYCEGGCGNRANVAAYRARKAARA
jgi:predicted RNA-binding Zn ribbon-like protein